MEFKIKTADIKAGKVANCTSASSSDTEWKMNVD